MEARVSRIGWILAGVTLLSACRSAAAQGVVQQPVVEVFSVDTVVSVPDRGSAFLGGVSTARSGYSTYGPLDFSQAYGCDNGFSYVDVSVFIHDFEAMDEALLAAPTIASPPPRSGTLRAPEAAEARPVTRAQAAWRALQKRR
jgi:hypothetical protein